MAKSTKKPEKAGKELQKLENSGSVDKLHYWKDKYAESLNDYEQNLRLIDKFFDVYEGSGDIYNSKGAKAKDGTSSVRKVVFELIESQADIDIPMPKVVSNNGNEERAMTIEHYLRNEIDRLDFAKIADAQARITPIAGSSFFLVEWDNSVKTRNTIGRLKVSNIDPKCIIPQKGTFNVADADYIFIRLLQSKSDIKLRYGIELNELKTMEQTEPDMDSSNNDELVTHIFCYYKDEFGKISLFSWVDDTVINDLENYFARKKHVCSKCGKDKVESEDKCKCGSKNFKLVDVVNETITIRTETVDPMTGQPVVNEQDIHVPYYTPSKFPIVKRNNVYKRDSFLGSSDVDAIEDQQNDLNITMAKIKEKLLKGGSILTLPEGAKFKPTNEELKIVRIKTPAEKALIGVDTMQPNISNDLGILELNYNVARQTIGITNSYQGREDTTALSGKAKEISATNAAGRFESKKVMKNDAYGDLYEIMFQFMLAYADEPRTLYYQDEYGKMNYTMFDKRMFIDRDSNGNYYYDDEFVFSTDISSTLANNRQMMWQETRNNFVSGSYGDPADVNTLVMYWQMMDSLHYPGAKQALTYASQRLEQQRQAQAEQAELQRRQLDMQVQTATENSQAHLMKSQAALAKAQNDSASNTTVIEPY